MERYKKLTFSNIIPDVVSRFANHKALGFVDEELLTYAQMGKRIDAVMAFLEDSGIKQGDKVVIYSQNMPNWGIAYFAMHRMGIIVVPVLPDFNPHELNNVLQHSNSKTLFVSKSLEYKLKDIEDGLLEQVVCIDDFNILKGNNHSVVFNMDAKPAGVYDTNENELAVLLYTSGTTEGPKGVMLSQKNVITNAYQAGKVQPICEHDKFLSVLPLAHTYENTLGLILPILMGASVTYLRTPPTASVLVPAMQKVKPDLMLTVPAIIEKVYKNKARTDEVMTPDGWFKTGDLGVFDKKGRLSHKGRLNNLIVGANGKNIYPEEIEFLINNYSYVHESIVVAKKDKLVAMVHFNREELENKISKMTTDMTNKVDDKINELASELHDYVNKKVNKYSRINVLLVHPEPFKKTATQKIKRYLYQQ